MAIPSIKDLFLSHPGVQSILESLKKPYPVRMMLSKLHGSSIALTAWAIHKQTHNLHLIIAEDKERAAYLLNDLENLSGERGKPFEKRKILFFPTSYRRPYEIETTDNANVLSRAEVLNKVMVWAKEALIITYPEALSEKVITRKNLKKNTFSLRSGEEVSMDFLTDMLLEYGFERVDFVAEPGQFAIRGGIVDVYSFSHEYPFRIEFDGDAADSIRTFDPASQLSLQKIGRIDLLPNIQDRFAGEFLQNLIEYLPENTVVWAEDLLYLTEKLTHEFQKASEIFANLSGPIKHKPPEDLFVTGEEFTRSLLKQPVILFGTGTLPEAETITFNTLPQPPFSKNFQLLLEKLTENNQQQFINYIFSDNPRQLERIRQITEDMGKGQPGFQPSFEPVNHALHEGFSDLEIRAACYTDHQIFDRYHRYRLREGFAGKEAITLKDLYNLKPGDYVTHIDHGIGRFDGLEIIENNGRAQEVIRLIYQNQDVLYVSIHSLHRVAKYTGKDGTPPSLNRLGSNAWNTLKNRTRQRVKDIARELIQLYARRKASEGFAFSPDTYLQHELEASFLYEDTPDQYKATLETKLDMEKSMPMDRLVCGDVGFGKTEVAIRAAFKAVTDSKQVAVLVPTTILALQHYKTFTDRLKDFPCRIEYMNRFKSAGEQKKILPDIEKGNIDILIGTHRILSKDIRFANLGLVIVDEEQKFGVSAKEKLKELRVNVDTLTLTATPIPRTLQFSLLGARDLSVINTPPANRQPVHTEIRPFGEDTIRDAIRYELNRGGQIFFVHNRVQNILDVSGMIQRFVPDARIAVAHGQMEGKKLETTMTDFIDGDYDILVATTIIESGLDITNVNTIIINDAHHYGLSDLHQLRGRVGRSNKKAFCYLLSPPLSTLTDEARKRLRAIEEFSTLGSGFNIAMRDLDIRGAGNLLGAEQSGFIADLGYETYQKILDEAIRDLKTNEFQNLFDPMEEDPVRECLLETDLEIRIPVEYIGNIAERLSLYKELDTLESETELEEFSLRLKDRFGPIPPSTLDLLDTFRLRRNARKLGIEKVIMKNNQFICYFVSDPDSSFYQSGTFTRVLQYVQSHPKSCRMKENQGKLSLTVSPVNTIETALRLLRNWEEPVRSEN